MAHKRIRYLLVLALCVVFDWFYAGWFSWFLLVLLLTLPLLSLLVSLPAMLSLRLAADAPAAMVGETLRAEMNARCRLPAPACRAKLRVEQPLTQTDCRRRIGEALPTEHCGALTITPVKARVYDYMGLFRLPVRHVSPCRALVRPRRVAVDPPPDVARYLASAFRPKAGGGFAENHDLRLYRPGDNLSGIHWKLTAKTGKLIYREPLEPLRGRAIVTLALCGGIDEKLGKLLWVSEYLLAREIPHTICCLTGGGLVCTEVGEASGAQAAIDTLLCCTPAAPDASVPPLNAAWRFHIGGDGDA